MGDQSLEHPADGPENSYKIIVYKTLELPQEYHNLIIAPFLNSLRYGNDLFKLIDKQAYFTSYSKYIQLLLQRPNAQVKLAILSDRTVIGWSMVEKNIVHYVWVKKEVRRNGVGRSLLPKEFDTITHVTNKAIGIWVNYYKDVKFDPFS